MLNLKTRVLAGSAVAALAVTGAVYASTSASADTDPITGGTTTIDLALPQVTTYAASGLVVGLTGKPATEAYDSTNNVVEIDLPVTGGNASVNTFYGTVKHAGTLVFINAKKSKTTTLTNITFDISNDTISATPAGATSTKTPATASTAKPVVFFDAVGNHDFTPGSPETFSASDLQIDSAGATYLNKALGVTTFAAGQHFGTFSTTFTNTNDS